VHEVQLPFTNIRGRLIRAVDLRPGTPAIVRSAEIIATNGAEEQVLALWQPGESPAVLEANAAFRVPASAAMVLRIRYRRHFGDPATDLSQVGVYFAKGGGTTIQTLEFDPENSRPHIRRLERPIRAVAVLPVSGVSGMRVRLAVIAADGSRRELATLQLRGDWRRRYIFDAPVSLAAGDRIEASVIPSESQLWSSLTGEPMDPAHPVRVALEFVK
jgi:hypothetical protein